MASTDEIMILLAAADLNTAVLAPLLRKNRPNFQEPETLQTPLHKAILACAPPKDAPLPAPPPDPEKTKAAETTLRLLLENGAIWNDLDKEGMTPGCYAYKYGLKELYEIMVDAGVRAELLFSRLDGYMALEDDDDEDEEDTGKNATVEDVETSESKDTEDRNAHNTANTGEDGEEIPTLVEDRSASAQPEGRSPGATQFKSLQPGWKDPTPVTSPAYLSSRLTYHSDKLLDSSLNGVMMSWETDIMARTTALLLPDSKITTEPGKPGPRILNIGFGMGIIDTKFQERCIPSLHTICEAHPDVLAYLISPDSPWPKKPGVEILSGRWQDELPALVARGEVYDAIYFDTFAEDYSALREFFNEYVIALLNPDGGKFGFFNGLGADRQISYDVYKKVVEMDLFEAGLETSWEVVKVPELDKEGDQNVWEGVRRKYWSLEEYWVPICTFLLEM
ncbi:S-adenosyl-L-methionine-dependent methyltransferase [Kalaharituber pfeilii]|nr:S-adenosyl-L-methionine-dependent methyltransferase [Kalaharituber pfeilii]